VKVTRFGPDGKVAKTWVVNVDNLIKDEVGKRGDNTPIELEPGDVVFVPQRII
jgi:hypothetical protein